MFIKLFDVSGGVVVPTEHCFTIKWLKDLMDKYPKTYLKIYGYLQYMSSCNPDDNPYLAMSEDDREGSVVKDLDIDFSLDEKDIQLALTKCKMMFDHPAFKLWRTNKIALEKISKYLEETTPMSGKDGSMADYRATMKDIGNLTDAYNKGYKAYMEEVQMNMRGNKFVSQV